MTFDLATAKTISIYPMIAGVLSFAWCLIEIERCNFDRARIAQALFVISFLMALCVMMAFGAWGVR